MKFGKIKNSAFSGIIKDKFATTSYFTPDFLKRRVWLSTQDGTPLEIKTRKLKNKKNYVKIQEKILQIQNEYKKGDNQQDTDGSRHIQAGPSPTPDIQQCFNHPNLARHQKHGHKLPTTCPHQWLGIGLHFQHHQEPQI